MLYKQSERYQDFDTRSVISEPVQVVPVIEQQMPVTIRKYKTTKTTTTTHHLPQQQQQIAMSQINASALNSQNYNQSFEHNQGSMPQGYQRQTHHYYRNETNNSSSNNARSSSIPPSLAKAQFTDQNYSKSNSQIDQSSASMRYYNNKNMSSSSATNTFTQAPVNASSIKNEEFVRQGDQQQMRTGLASNSCIDYSNTYYNSDWYMRHGGINNMMRHQTSIPTELPIYMQRN